MNSTKTAASAGGKAAATPATSAKMSQFAATLAAQAAGQNVPVSTQTTAANVPLQQHVTAYDTAARIKAGLAAYGQVGEHRTHHSKPLDGTASDSAAAAGA